MKKTLKIQTDIGEVVVSKLPLGKYAELLKAIKELPKHLKGIEGKKVDDVIELIPAIAGEGLGDVIRVLSVATDLPEKDLQTIGLDDAIALFKAIWEVNNFSFIQTEIKKVIAQATPKIPQVTN